MIQQTSILAYKDELLELGKHQKIILEAVKRLRSATNTEIAHYLGWSINRVTPRVYELRKDNYLALKEKRKCKITKKLVMCWEAI